MAKGRQRDDGTGMVLEPQVLGQVYRRLLEMMEL